MSEDPYLDPKTGVLKNKFGITDAKRLDYIEREWVVQRIAEGCPTGKFDLAHLQAIHRHLFQDVYSWAGEIRTVELAKNGDQFIPRSRIVMGMADVHNRLAKDKFLTGLKPPAFAEKAAEIIGDVNHVHPFREGNGRTQLHYLQQLARHAGHDVDITQFKDGWIAASRASHQGNYGPMAQEIGNAMTAQGDWSKELDGEIRRLQRNILRALGKDDPERDR